MPVETLGTQFLMLNCVNAVFLTTKTVSLRERKIKVHTSWWTTITFFHSHLPLSPFSWGLTIEPTYVTLRLICILYIPKHVNCSHWFWILVVHDGIISDFFVTRFWHEIDKRLIMNFGVHGTTTPRSYQRHLPGSARGRPQSGKSHRNPITVS